jgi:hypothetical protein
MTFMVGVVLTAIAILFGLTTLGLAAGGVLRHPIRALASLAALLVLGLALLAE